MAFDIRSYHPSDLYSLYRICLLTADNGADGSHLYRDPELIGHYYAAPYAVLEPDLAFVLTHEGAPCGYVLATRDSAAFRRRCESEWFPPLRARYPLPAEDDRSPDAAMMRAIHRGHGVHEELGDNYPAHLHIDLLPVGQGQGQGRRMMDTLLARMRELAVLGVYLGVSKRNPRAVRFYQSCGFQNLVESETGIIYGMVL